MKFEELKLIDGMRRGVEKMGFTELTAIQESVIPIMRAGKDLVGLAPTGSGKTCAFGIPLIESIDKNVREVQALVLCPTRELAVQIESELKRLTEYVEGVRLLAVYGGQNFQRQLYGMRKKPQIVVGTTGRIMDHLRRKTLDLSYIRTIVLDEADEMLDMGFRGDIDTILESTGGGLQVVMFSATMSKEIAEISSSYQYNPETVKDNEAVDKPDIKQYYVKLKEEDKADAIVKIMDEAGYKLCLVFCNTKRRVDEIERKFSRGSAGYTVGALHGDMRQRQRDAVMKSFRSGELNILIATDVAARGIDVSDIELIINYDVPNNDEYYVHRIGRTGRAKKSGVAVTFATKATAHRIRECEKYAGTTIDEMKIAGLNEDFNVKTRINSKANMKTVRLFLNIGTKDGYDTDSLKSYICALSEVPEEKITEVKLMELFGFVEVEESFAPKIVALTGEKAGKRRLSVEKAGERSAKPAFGGDKFKKSYEKKSSERKSYAKSEDKPYEKRDSERKPFVKSDEKRSYEKKSSERKSYAKNEDKPYEKRDSERRLFVKNDEKKSYEKKSSEIKSYTKNEDKQYEKRDSERRPFVKNDERKSYEKKSSERKSYAKSEDKPYEKRNSERRPFVKNDEKKSYEKKSSERKSYAKTDSTLGGQHKAAKVGERGGKAPRKPFDAKRSYTKRRNNE